MFQQIFDARIRYLWNLYEASGGLQHPDEKGLLRELFLRRVFDSVLSYHFAVGSGVVVDKWKRQSPQIDLVIFDRRRIPSILEEKGRGLDPMDAVLRVIEVKSILDKPALIQFRTLAETFNPNNPQGLKIAAKGTLEGGRSYYPFAGLFAYKTSLTNVHKTQQDLGGFDKLTAFIMCCYKNNSSIFRLKPRDESSHFSCHSFR